MSPDNPGYAAGIAKRDKAERIHWTLKAAPKRTKDLVLNSIEAVAMGRKLRKEISEKMSRKGLQPGDAVVIAVFAYPDLSKLAGWQPLEVEANGGDLKIATVFVGSLPIGFLIFVWDRAANEIYGHVRPLIVGKPVAWELNDEALHMAEANLKNSLTMDGLIPDERN